VIIVLKNPSDSTFPVIAIFIRSPAATLNDVMEMEINERFENAHK
jgi:hypothetical protein